MKIVNQKKNIAPALALALALAALIQVLRQEVKAQDRV